MSGISVFYNNRIVSESSKNSLGILDRSVEFGDWCLTPVRCLFDGNKVTYSFINESPTVDHEKEYATSIESRNQPKRNFLRVMAAIVLLIPGVIIGSVFKGLGYLSATIRHRHYFAVLHYTPLDHTIGSLKGRLSLSEIRQQLDEFKKKNHLNWPIENLVIYAKRGTAIDEDPGFLKWNPQKVILVGARIVHQKSSGLDDILSRSSGWECRSGREARMETDLDDVTHIYQWSRRSVADALKDVPPRISQFSFKRYHRVYNIV